MRNPLRNCTEKRSSPFHLGGNSSFYNCDPIDGSGTIVLEIDERRTQSAQVIGESTMCDGDIE